jgi:hypothetical protein
VQGFLLIIETLLFPTMDMSVYTLRGYSTHWQATSPDHTWNLSEGDIPLPALAPASQWTIEIEFLIPAEEYITKLSIMSPTDFSVINYSYNAKGEFIP